MNVPDAGAIEPFFPGLFDFASDLGGSLELVASHCTSCGRNSYPAKRYCSFCHSAAQSKLSLSGQGRIYAFTSVERPPKSAAGPYVAAYIDMEESVRLFAKIDAKPESLKIGDQVRVVFGPLEGSMPRRLGYWFVPSAMETL